MIKEAYLEMGIGFVLFSIFLFIVGFFTLTIYSAYLYSGILFVGGAVAIFSMGFYLILKWNELRCRGHIKRLNK